MLSFFMSIIYDISKVLLYIQPSCSMQTTTTKDVGVHKNNSVQIRTSILINLR